jgi:hypothetical protein
MNEITITHYADGVHRSQLVALWETVFGYEAAHNKPDLAIVKGRGGRSTFLCG